VRRKGKGREGERKRKGKGRRKEKGKERKTSSQVSLAYLLVGHANLTRYRNVTSKFGWILVVLLPHAIRYFIFVFLSKVYGKIHICLPSFALLIYAHNYLCYFSLNNVWMFAEMF
jgi:hypothetical protein